MTFTLAEGTLAQVSAILDDDERMEKDLCSEIDKIYAIRIKMVKKLQHDL